MVREMATEDAFIKRIIGLIGLSRGLARQIARDERKDVFRIRQGSLAAAIGAGMGWGDAGTGPNSGAGFRLTGSGAGCGLPEWGPRASTAPRARY